MKRGFTIWEMLGVIVIVLLIAAILLPVFYGPRDHSPRISCLSQEKQLGLTLIQYTDNYDGFMPPPTHNIQYTWRNAVYAQIKSNSINNDIYKCPEDDRPVGPDGFFQSYAFNAGSVLSKWGAKPDSYATVPHPETLVLLCEVQNTDYAALDIDDAVRFTPSKHILAVRHKDGANFLFADGHTRWFRPSAFSATSAAIGKPPVRWHRDPHHPLSKNALAVLADAQARAQ